MTPTDNLHEMFWDLAELLAFWTILLIGWPL